MGSNGAGTPVDDAMSLRAKKLSDRARQRLFDDKKKHLNNPNVQPLTNLIRGWKQQCPGRDFPFVDPDDGGIFAKVLFLQHTPGRRAVTTGYVSIDNPDPTAWNVSKALGYAGFGRADYICWNVVPYFISTEDKDGKATTAQIRDAAHYTQAFIGMLPHLRVVVFCGRKAQRQAPFLTLPDSVERLCAYQCGAQSFNRSQNRTEILSAYQKAHSLMIYTNLR
jgi:uracil-DNA glycosylase